jgi:hypothetical protein
MWRRAFLPRLRGALPAQAAAPEERRPVLGPPQVRGAGGARPLTGCACGGGCSGCRAPAPRAAPAAASPLDPALRATAEARLGVPLGDVRLTTRGPLADRARARGADAAAGGNVLAFPHGLPDPREPAGRFAIGHELGHIAQARGARAPAPGGGSDAEARADAAGRAMGGTPGATGAPGGAAHPAPERVGGATVSFGIFNPLLDFAANPEEFIGRASPGLNIAQLRVLAALPGNILQLIGAVNRGERAADIWLGQLVLLFVNWRGTQPLIDHLLRGVQDGALLAGEILGAVIDVVGVNEFAHALFVTSGALSRLDPSEEAASRRVHPPGLIPYASVLVDRGGIVARLAAIQGTGAPVINQILGGTGAAHRSVTTMHVIHTGLGTMSPGLAVHELTHVGQYTMAGAAYMAQALHAQLAGEGYDYNRRDGSLAASIAAGRGFLDFNREQQAQLCEDYYDVRGGGTASFGGTLAELEHFVQSLWAARGAPWPAGGP